MTGTILMSSEELDRHICQYFGVLTQSARGLVHHSLYLFDGLAEDTDHAADILLSEAYIEAAWTILLGKTTYRSFLSWFVGIMCNLLKRKRRLLEQKRLQLQMPQSTLFSVQPLSLEGDPLDSFLSLTRAGPEHQCEMRAQVEWFLSFLNAQDRMIVDLYFFQSVPGPEIAQRFQWSNDHFRTHLCRIMRSLRAIAKERMND
jgi:DNA-directed RNA polymerase specialized sigma24 family protein